MLMKMKEPGNVDQQTIDRYQTIGAHLETALNELAFAEQQVYSLGMG